MGNSEFENRGISRTYHSLFEKVDWEFIGRQRVNNDKTESKALKNETVSDVLGYLDWAYASEPSDQLAIAHKALGPSRIIRGVLDYKIENAESPFLDRSVIEPFVTYTTSLALALYQDPPKAHALDLINQYRQTIPRLSRDHRLFQGKVDHIDSYSWHYTHPELSEKTANRLAKDLAHEPLLFIPLAHGGVPSGLDVFLRYGDITKNRESLVYPVRFSMHKKEDATPRLTDEEGDYLQRMARGRHVVLFDDDSANPYGTMSRAKGFFRELFPKDQSLRSQINEYAR